MARSQAAVPAAALPNRLAVDMLHLRSTGDRVVSLDPARAGWRYLSFATSTVDRGAEIAIPSDDAETVLVVLGGGGVVVSPTDGGATLDLVGRRSVWDGLPWAAYLPRGHGATVVAVPLDPHQAVDVAIARAPSTARTGVSRRPILIRPDDCRVETRGAGNATRHIAHIVAPAFPAARLLLVECHTPAGNWSSWPPHKHDVDAMPDEAVLEEVYCYRFRRPEDWGIQRVYRRTGTPLERSSGPRAGLWEVRSGDVVMVTDGYHPFVASPGAAAYYLNALAGDRRTMACSFDPDQRADEDAAHGASPRRP